MTCRTLPIKAVVGYFVELIAFIDRSVISILCHKRLVLFGIFMVFVQMADRADVWSLIAS